MICQQYFTHPASETQISISRKELSWTSTSIHPTAYLMPLLMSQRHIKLNMLSPNPSLYNASFFSKWLTESYRFASLLIHEFLFKPLSPSAYSNFPLLLILSQVSKSSTCSVYAIYYETLQQRIEHPSTIKYVNIFAVKH